jgi:hypothetical protein
MDIDTPMNRFPSIHHKKVSWATDLGVSTLSEELFSHMSEQKRIAEETGTISDIPVSKLFKSFASTLKKADPSIVFHPFQASKQHYSSLVTAKKNHSIEDSKIHQFFLSPIIKNNFSR